MPVVGRQQPKAGVIMFGLLYQGENTWQCPRAPWMDPNRSGNGDRYFSVLNCASENGLSLETYGQAWVLVTPRSASRSATGFEVIAGSRSGSR